MKRIKILKAGEVEVDSYKPHSFTKNQDFLSSIEVLSKLNKMNSKKNIKKIAKKSGLTYDNEKMLFAMEIINTMLNEIDNEN